MNIKDIFEYVRKKMPKIEEYENDYRVLISMELLVDEIINRKYQDEFQELIDKYTSLISTEYSNTNIEGIILSERESSNKKMMKCDKEFESKKNVGGKN
ncbi:MAG: hypothetical protein U9Q73_01860 [Nanoarchaeota archaeon]|nr:hypothetical protein [Nanoarchaeota archaeon]